MRRLNYILLVILCFPPHRFNGRALVMIVPVPCHYLPLPPSPSFMAIPMDPECNLHCHCYRECLDAVVIDYKNYGTEKVPPKSMAIILHLGTIHLHRPGNIRAFNFSVFKVELKARHCGDIFVVKSLLKAPAPRRLIIKL